MIGDLKQLGLTVCFGRPYDKLEHSLSILVFTDGGRSSDQSQISTLCGFLTGSRDQYSYFHVASWTLHKFNVLVRTIAARETIAAAENIDEEVVLYLTYSVLPGFTASLIAMLNSKDLSLSISSQCGTIDMSARANVNHIRYQFEVVNAVLICWVLDRFNLADLCTKSDSSLAQPLRLLLFSRKFLFAFPKLEANNTNDKRPR